MFTNISDGQIKDFFMGLSPERMLNPDINAEARKLFIDGYNFVQSENILSGIQCFKESAECEIVVKTHRALCFNYIADLFCEIRMKDEAIKYAAMPKEEFKSKWFAHNCDYIIAKAYFVSGEHESSIDILKKQIRISNTKDDKVLAEKHCLLAQNYEALSDFSNCLYHANTAKQLFRSDAGETKIVEEYIQKVELLSSKRS